MWCLKEKYERHIYHSVVLAKAALKLSSSGHYQLFLNKILKLVDNLLKGKSGRGYRVNEVYLSIKKIQGINRNQFFVKCEW